MTTTNTNDTKAEIGYLDNSAGRSAANAARRAVQLAARIAARQAATAAANKTKSEKITATGILERVELKIEAPYNSYKYFGGQTKEVFLDCAMVLPNGDTAYFKTPRGTFSIASGGNCAFPVYILDNIPAWIAENPGSNPIATPGKPSTARIEPLVQVGQAITITGTVKARKVSRLGKPYVALNRVKFEGMPINQPA